MTCGSRVTSSITPIAIPIQRKRPNSPRWSLKSTSSRAVPGSFPSSANQKQAHRPPPSLSVEYRRTDTLLGIQLVVPAPASDAGSFHMDSFTRTSRVARREPGVLAATSVRVLAWLTLAFVPLCAFGQSAVPAGEPRRVAASRVELDSLAGRAAAAADAPATPEQQRESLRRYAVDLRTRLRDGDFQPGDRIVLVTRGDSTSIDTLTVESDRTVSFRKLPSIPLNGVLRSELRDYLSEQLRKYVKRDVVSAIPLVSVGVLGDVLHPGYYRVALEITMGDLLMVAGGPLPQADLTRVSVRRGQTTIVDER